MGRTSTASGELIEERNARSWRRALRWMQRRMGNATLRDNR